MGEFNIVEEMPLSLAELKEKLDALMKEGEGKLSYRGEKTKTYIDAFVEMKGKEAQALTEKIIALNIPRLKDRHVVKIVDVMPKDIDSLRLLFSNETITIKEEDLKKILDVINN